LMYHGTPNLENAALIEQNGFKASTDGLLGPGVYVSRDVEKARKYAERGVIFEVTVPHHASASSHELGFLDTVQTIYGS